jgi:hypothetical protein
MVAHADQKVEKRRKSKPALSPFVVSQILAGMAFALGLASFQFKPRHLILLCLVGSTLLNSAHFFLLEKPGPATLMLLTGIRYLAALSTANRQVMYFFFLITLGSFLLTFKSPLSFLALLGSFVGTYGSFHPSDRGIRLFFMGGNLIWLIHNTLAATPVAAIMEAAFLTSSVLGYWRFHRARRDSIPVRE